MKRNGNEMFKVYKKEIEVAGKKISLETGKIARQADGAIIASSGETVILATVVGAKKVNPDMDYFPWSGNYQEKYYHKKWLWNFYQNYSLEKMNLLSMRKK